MFSITYSSECTDLWSETDLHTILVHAQATNAELSITGALLYRDGRFVQILEGPEAAVRQRFAAISADPRHTIDLVTEETTTQRRFPTWTMGFRPVTGQGDLAATAPNSTFESFSSNPEASFYDNEVSPAFDWLYQYWLLPEAPNFARTVDDSPTAPPTVTTSAPSLASPADLSPAISRPPSAADRSLVGTSDVVATIFDKIMTEVHNGKLLPGDRVHDSRLAEQFGVSRTPVREALQKLREIGIVEVAANRFTRISVLDPEETGKLLTVFIALYSAALEEVIGQVDQSVIAGLHEDKAKFLLKVSEGDVVHIASAGVDFYLRLISQSQNEALKKGISSSIHVIKIASAHLESLVGMDVIIASLDELIAAATIGDAPRAKWAVASLGRIAGPQASAEAIESTSDQWMI